MRGQFQCSKILLIEDLAVGVLLLTCTATFVAKPVLI